MNIQDLRRVLFARRFEYWLHRSDDMKSEGAVESAATRARREVDLAVAAAFPEEKQQEEFFWSLLRLAINAATHYEALPQKNGTYLLLREEFERTHPGVWKTYVPTAP